eukprot:CAMPEP_0172838926 /NCGR_PEP_ID=MMETSP1075-20121228/28215_1 /TAXON_ID=2916 /ORGANISM="Ceratium fusus, Strain PA161109" /LENGTH=370 /DNA_ID=CAMNT_0013682507 /DNA_START=61 /DNA_END=1173 /DNA_ORIENTATION=+
MDRHSGSAALSECRKSQLVSVAAANICWVSAALSNSAAKGKRKCSRKSVLHAVKPNYLTMCRCTTSGGTKKLMYPPSRWAGAGVGVISKEETVALRLNTPVKDVIEALLKSHSVCVENEEGRLMYVKVTDGKAAGSSEALNQPSDSGYACIELADLLEAPRETPLSCLIGKDESEECTMYGSLPEPYNELRPLPELASRLPWLVGLLAFLTVSSGILEYYDDLLQRHLVIAFYLTVLVGCGGNSGSQAAALVLQGMATGELAPTAQDAGNVLCKELIIALGIAAALCTGVSIRILLFGSSPGDAFLIALAMAVTVVFSVGFGAVAPLALQRAGLEPAKVSGPLLSTVIDIVGVLAACLSAALLESVGLFH